MMMTCIYCKATPPDARFTKAEHVIPQAFGKFVNNLTLNGVVCDDCNSYFGRELEIDFARDTPAGIDRYRLGLRPPESYKTVGRRSNMVFRALHEDFNGAMVRFENVDGRFMLVSLPQVGFQHPDGGPIRWFAREQLPDEAELNKLFSDGLHHIQFLEIADVDAVVGELRERGAQITDATVSESKNKHYKGMPFEVMAHLGPKIGRCISKIAFNYLASQTSPSFVLMAQFDVIRRYIRYGRATPSRVWTVDNRPLRTLGGGALRHILTIEWLPDTQTVFAQLSLHSESHPTYTTKLAIGGFLVQNPFKNFGHLFDLSTHQITRLVRSAI